MGGRGLSATVIPSQVWPKLDSGNYVFVTSLSGNGIGVPYHQGYH